MRGKGVTMKVYVNIPGVYVGETTIVKNSDGKTVTMGGTTFLRTDIYQWAKAGLIQKLEVSSAA